MPMPRKLLILYCAVAILCVGCVKAKKTASVDQARMGGFDQVQRQAVAYHSLPMTARIRSASLDEDKSDTVFAAGRFVAVQHKLEIVEPGSGLPKSIEAVVAFAAQIGRAHV